MSDRTLCDRARGGGAPLNILEAIIMDMNVVGLGMKVASARKAAGLTQAELAREVGTKQAAISKIETGRVVPTLPVLDRIARALGSTIVITLGPEPEVDRRRSSG